MDAKKTLKKYAGIPAWRKVVSWLLAALAVFSLLMCTAFKKTDDVNAAVPFDPISSKNSEYVYLDIVGVSDWAYKVTNDSATTYYYFAQDADGYYYTLTAKNQDLSNMTAQRNYWDDENAAMPKAERVYGTPGKLSSEMKTDLASECWEISVEEFENYFGDKALYTGVTPAGQSNDLWIFATFMAGLFWLLIAFLNRTVNKNLKKCLAVLKANDELEAAAEELNAENTVEISKKSGKISEHYVFGRKTGSVLRHADIAWVYPSVTRSYGAAVRSSLVANTLGRKSIEAMKLDAFAFQDEASKAISMIAEHNPNVLIGMTKDNTKKYKELRKSAK